MTDIDDFYTESGVSASAILKGFLISGIIINIADAITTYMVVDKWGTQRESVRVVRTGFENLGVLPTLGIKLAIVPPIAYAAYRAMKGERVPILTRLLRVYDRQSKKQFANVVLFWYIVITICGIMIVGSNISTYNYLTHRDHETEVKGVLIDGRTYAPTGAAKQAYLPELQDLEKKCTQNCN